MKYLITILMVLTIACSDETTGYKEKPVDTDSDSAQTLDKDGNPILLQSPLTLEEVIESADCLEGEVPENTCIDEKLYRFSGEFTLVDDECSFTFEVQICDDGCADANHLQQEDHCRNPCDDVICETPTEAHCEDEIDGETPTYITLRVYNTDETACVAGDVIDGKWTARCEYNYEDIQCNCIVNPNGADYCE